MNAVLTTLRFPASLAFGLALTGSLFWTLWFFTNDSVPYKAIETVRIDFTRVDRDETLTTKDRAPKVEREQVDIDIALPALSGAPTGLETSIVLNPTPEVNLGPRGIPVAGSDRDVAPLVRVEPTYPPRALQNEQEGWVRVQFNVSASGAVTDVLAVESEPGTVFDAAAVSAVSRWRYSPSVEQGTAVERVGLQTLIRFTLED